VERLGLANQGSMTGKGLSKGPKAIIRVDVVNDDCADGVTGPIGGSR
jgi:hypothetical protein